MTFDFDFLILLKLVLTLRNQFFENSISFVTKSHAKFEKSLGDFDLLPAFSLKIAENLGKHSSTFVNFGQRLENK